MIHSKLGRLGGTCEANRGFERQTDTARGTSASGNASAPGVLGTNSEGMLQVIGKFLVHSMILLLFAVINN
uniref:Uncharacterized protein n=1 Tax=Anguilla anguilla TaxID=7936 RepID=A0A0E9RK52_ANGAN